MLTKHPTLTLALIDRYKDIPQNLMILEEEAGEIVRIASKCFRFGLNHFHVKNGAVNRTALEHEIGHLLYAVEVLIRHNVISEEGILIGMSQKEISYNLWYNENREELF